MRGRGSLPSRRSAVFALILAGAALGGVTGCGTANPSAPPQPTRMAIRTLPSPGPNDICLLARGGGTLVVDPGSGLGVADTTGRIIHVLWPFGYAARADGDRLALVDGRNRIAAHVGDVITMAGGFGSNDEWVACQAEPITVLSTPLP